MTAPKKKKDDSFKEFVLDALSGLDGLRVRPMFGGQGLYLKDDFFGMAWKGKLYFRADDATRPAYEKGGGEAFCVTMRGKKMTMQYWSVPADVLEDHEELARWAVRAARAYRESKQR
ncbi:MAG TPA: TfoX/Sxy family protein [Candidatus Binatia bacterium]|jgi:DNA transformation protein|nr:TfoX/Sxy family protein [Candidatus Binatia bacterium]